MDHKEILEKDLEYNWHPYTQMKDAVLIPPIPIKAAHGIRLYDYRGNYYYDTISSWWCNIHGHAHPAMIKAIRSQVSRLDHVLFAGFTHEPAVMLSDKLLAITPEHIRKIFYSDNGSTSVEIALKMSYQYWKNIGRNTKEKFISLDMAYHGDTFGAMSVSGVDKYNRTFSNLFFDSFKVPAPYCYRCPYGSNKETCGMECLNALQELLRDHSGQIAAMIIEPLLLGAGGMIVYPPGYLSGVYELLKEYDVHMIVDEVATGFGRTGKMFASDHVSIRPDIMCFSKGITSGYLPLGATAVTEKIYDAFYDDHKNNKTFFHGHTYTANPIACAAAVSSLDLFDKYDALGNARRIHAGINGYLDSIMRMEHVGDTRSIGTVGAIELVADKHNKTRIDPDKRIGMEIYKMGLEKNLILRPLGDIIYLYLPLVTEMRDLTVILENLSEVLYGIKGKI